MTIDADDPRLPSVQIADALRTEIDNKVLKPGQKLPAHTKLAERFGVASQTVQNGLRILRDEGLIESAGQRGTFVADTSKHQQATTDKGVEPDSVSALHRRVEQLEERVAALEERPHRT
ncbi:GntR family transcriptional regulator [Streptomyces sp. WMMB 714]|uniref:GntR family transcriptional regulator n=1 Tax=Streptomyces sp. WMMB 714 TaxID=1286822 RepID=UPI0005F854DC|nr:winged helix-turn-helix domain-containing protein [Streptomyces sp. WMMB 714]